MENNYENIQCVSLIADAIDGVTYFVGRTFKTGMNNLRRKK
ncbi:hypothetical protein RJG79_01975 [Mycoplasmatota bacterium WC44]